MVELKQRILNSLSKIGDNDTSQFAVEELIGTIQSLQSDAVPTLLNCLFDVSSSYPKSVVRKESIRLFSVLCGSHPDSTSTHLVKITTHIAKRLRDTDSGVRDSCIETIGSLSGIYLQGDSENGVVSLFIMPLFKALGDNNKVVQVGAAMCLRRVVECAKNPPVASFQKLSPRICKFLNSPNCFAKSALLSVVATLSQVSAIAPQNLDLLLQLIHECLISTDWATRKAAADTLIAFAMYSSDLIKDGTASTLTVLEASRFDKIKPVRDSMTEALQLWKRIACITQNGASDEKKGSGAENSGSRNPQAAADTNSSGIASLRKIKYGTVSDKTTVNIQEPQLKSPTKHTVLSKSSDVSKKYENYNPNLLNPDSKSLNSPSIKSTKTPKSTYKGNNTNCSPISASPRPNIRERKFVVAKKSKHRKLGSDCNCTCKEKTNGKCLCVAYENLRASQEDFFKNRISDGADQTRCDLEEELAKLEIAEINNIAEASELQKPIIATRQEDVRTGGDSGVSELGYSEPDEGESPNGMGSSIIKRTRNRMMEEARQSVPEPGSGRVMHLVQAFEKLLSIPKAGEEDDKKMEDARKGLKWELPGLQRPRAPATEDSSSSFCPGELVFNAESLGLGSCVSTSLDSGRESFSSRSSAGSRRSRGSSLSSGTVGGAKWKKQVKITSAKPFRLRTEQRGRAKEEEFYRKLQEMMIEEEKQRIPIAQGLPWTTDEPECLIKPPIKESTKPIDLKLHTDVRAEERADFDQQVSEKSMLIEQYKMEREIQQKFAEEEEIRRLRKLLVPKAQPMPYFDRPFVPRRSSKNPTVPKEPIFHIPQHKKMKSCLSWNDFSIYTQQQ